MRKKLLIAFAVLVGILGVLAVVVAMQPSEYRIERTAKIDAPPEIAFAQVNDFHNWDAWSPWAKLDPAMVATFEGPASGVGAIYKWSGNDKVGEGQMTILESKPDEFIRFKLEFLRPFPDTCTTEFTFKPEGASTSAIWTMTGRRNFMAKGVCLVMDMDKMVGGDFENGLAQMKTVCEEKAKAKK